MLCTSPLDLPNGKVVCNQCMNCRINHKLKWLGRMVLEARHFHSYSFITLTYADEHLPKDGSVNRPDLRAWLEKMRRQVGEFRYFAVAEYGEDKGRAHYHVIHFGGSGTPAWRAIYENAWTGNKGLRGRVQTEDPRDKKAAMAYCLGYVTKKMTSAKDDRLDGRTPEFFSCSLHPPIGRSGMVHLSRMLNTRQGAQAIAAKGFPRGFILQGQYYPFMRRDRHFVMEKAGYTTEMDDHLEDIDSRAWLEFEEMEVYNKAQTFSWSNERLKDAIVNLRAKQDAEETERRRIQAALRAEKRRRNHLKLVKPPKDPSIA